MKISVEIYTLAEKFGDFKAIEILKEAGFDAVDYSYYYNKDCDEVLGDGYIEYAKKIREHLDKVGLSCNQAHAPFHFAYGSEMNESDPMYRSIVRSIESAAILGAKSIVVHSALVPEDVDGEAYNVEFYKSLIPYCEKAGIKIAIENLFLTDKKRGRFASRFGTPETLNALIEKVDSPYAVACIDVAHAELTGTDADKFIRKVKPGYLQALHIHDNDYITDKHLLPYSGKFNWENIMTALKDYGYEGELTLEVIGWLSMLPDELLPAGMKFAAETARHLTSIFDKN